ncbi:MAG: hypothetical protein U1A22_10270 [Xanthomonadaceae bacterium]|nr:hypothetical protein [Xanthomonadaceae bacterium]
MTDYDYDQEEASLRRQRHFLDDVEREIRRVNREAIHAVVPPLGRLRFLDLARIVARRRVDYLRLALELSECAPDDARSQALLDQMPTARKNYFESREAFAALERAIERGYIDVARD